jgi:glyoxylase-like metal-dependent hydrolase (beta-lactamase superfamily II)
MALLEISRVSETIWMARRPSYLACSYLIAVDRGFVAVDAGMESGGADIKAALAAVGARPEALQAVLLTHWHNDHAAGAAALAASSGAAVYYSAAEAPFLTGATAFGGLRGWLAEQVPEMGLLVLVKGLLGNATPTAVTANRLVREGEVIEGAFRVVETPGHTPGHLAYFHEPTRTLFCGDALAVVGGRIRLMARPVTPDLAAARASALRCLRESPAVLCPGHRRPLTTNLATECDRLQSYLASNASWPLLG